MKTALMIILLLIPMSVFSYSIILLTDESPPTKAQELQTLFKSIYPFNQFDLGLTIVTVAKDVLDCKSHPDIERLILCNNGEMGKMKFKYGANQVITIADLPIYGGSGGAFPVMTTVSPSEVALHELMHNLKFTDEYSYSAAESDFYCKKSIKAPNSVVLKKIDRKLNSNKEALKIFKKKLPWKKYLTNNSIITHNDGTSLGTGPISGCESYNFSDSPKKIEVGLFLGATCDQADPQIPVWHPGAKKTIMKELQCGLSGYYEKVIYDILKKKRAKFKWPF